ncbi:hypothetical protein [Halomonas sp. 328]|uniref:hypothetical protein n=1 Tax=Halomonas sp. 328 TaxID=2776704 RepID=UPI0018A6DEA4|nr:hypothetical protein [Halomonas sp. 328]MBF8221491.1 hypothetical protein [Halomonas sp. 328]
MTQPANRIEQSRPQAGLAEALGARLPGLAHDAIVPLADTGLAHEHLRLVGSGLLARAHALAPQD